MAIRSLTDTKIIFTNQGVNPEKSNFSSQKITTCKKVE